MAARLIEWLRARPEHSVHAIVTDAAWRVFHVETGGHPDLGVPVYAENDFDAPLASSSFLPDAMAVIPCSMRTLAGLARAENATLVMRAGDILLRLRRPLVVVPRETPLSLPAIENMAALARSGAVILPPVLAFYHRPASVQDQVDFVVGKVLDALGIGNDLYQRWGEA
jgi:4-hydroxy-3-polyprenylbenzoate decarboxylase